MSSRFWQIDAEYFETIMTFLLLLQKTVEVHVGADATLWCPLHHIQCHAVYRGVWNSLADPDALWDAVQLLPGKAGNARDANLALKDPVNIDVPVQVEQICLTLSSF